MNLAARNNLPGVREYLVVCVSIAVAAPAWMLILGIPAGGAMALYEVTRLTPALWGFGALPALLGVGSFFLLLRKAGPISRLWSTGGPLARMGLLMLINAPLVIAFGALLMLGLFGVAVAWLIWAPIPVLGGLIAGLWLSRSPRPTEQS